MKFTGERFIQEGSHIDDEISYEHLNRYYAISTIVKDKDVLDAACGSGYGTELISRFASFVHGIDIDEEAVEYARDHFEKKNLAYSVASITSIPFQDATFDIVVSFETIEHVDEITQKHFLEEIKRVLRPNGQLIISTPDKRNYSDIPKYFNEFHLKEFYSNEFLNFLKSRFKHVHFFYQRDEVVNLISNYDADMVNVVRKKYSDSTEGKYIIAVCSDVECKDNDSLSAVQIHSGINNQRMNRIVQLQNEVEEKNRWAFNLNNEIETLRTVISAERMRLEQKQEELARVEVLRSENEAVKREYEVQIGRLAESLEGKQEELVRVEGLLRESETAKREYEVQIGWLAESLEGKQEELARVEGLLSESEAVRKNIQNKLQEHNSQLEKQLEHMKIQAEISSRKASNIEAYYHLYGKYKEQELKDFFDYALKKKHLLLHPYKVFKKLVRLFQKINRLDFIFHRIPREFLERFDAGSYININADIQEAITQGLFENGLDHFILFGYEEVCGGVRKLHEKVELFTEESYLQKHTDVANAVKKGSFKDGFEHFLRFGLHEIVQGSRIDFTLSHSVENGLNLFDPQTVVISHELSIAAPIFEELLVSIIVPAYNQANYTFACIQSIIAHTSAIPYEIIVMDDKSPQEDAKNIDYFIKNIVFISNEENLGFLRNCNKGASFAKGKYVLFLNNDTNVQPGWLDALVELIESDDKIGMVGSRLIYPDGRQQEAGGIIWNDASGWNFGRLDDPNKPEYNYVKEVDYISGAAIMLSKYLWDEIGGFDERFIPAYYEDSDLAFEVRKHGYKVMYQPKSIVVHYEGISHGTDLGSGIKNHQVQNKEKFIQKWSVELREQFANSEHVFLARDRSKDQEHILVIDHYVPHYDKDAGSRTMWQYLFILKELGFHITFVGDNFFKHEPYTSILENAGIEVLYGPDYYYNFDHWLERNGQYFGAVYLLRPHISIKYIDTVKQLTSAKIFYNGTDFHFLRMQREYDISQDQKLLNAIKDMEAQEFELFEKADCVLTISDYERQYFENRFPEWEVKVIPTFIYKDDFPLSSNECFDTREGILFVGGFTHAPNLAGVKWFLDEIWPEVLALLPDLKFYIVGSNMPDELMQLKDENIIPMGFVEDEELERLYNSIKVVVAPLTFGAGVKGKVIESICHAIPIVTTSIGAEGIVDVSQALSIQDNSRKFAQEVVSLCTDSEKWRTLRQQEIAYAQKYYSYDYAKELVASIFGKGNHE